MKRMIDDSILTDIADAIREKNGTDNKYEDIEMAPAIRDIPSPKEEQEKTVEITENGTYDVLSDEGKSLSRVTVDVKVSSGDNFYDTFWDVYQQNGKRTNYESAFKDGNFAAENFKPKYDIIPTHAQLIFSGFPSECDLRELLNNCNAVLDLSNSTGSYCFNKSKFTALPTIDRSIGYNIYHWFSACTSLHTIEKLILNKGTNATDLNGFANCTALRNIVIEGEIGATFDIHWSPLTAESAKSILIHLVNYAGTEKAFVNSVLFADSVWELLNAEGATAPGDTTWEEYVNSIGWNK